MKALVIKQPGEAVTAQDTVALIGCGGVGRDGLAQRFAGGLSPGHSDAGTAVVSGGRSANCDRTH